MEPKVKGVTRSWFRHRRNGVAAGNAFEEVEYVPQLQEYFLQITRVCVEAEGSNPDKVRLYVKGHGYPHWVGEEAEPSHSILYWLEWPTYLTEGESLVARFYGMDAGNKLHMLVEGWAYDPPTIMTNVVVNLGFIGM